MEASEDENAEALAVKEAYGGRFPVPTSSSKPAVSLAQVTRARDAAEEKVADLTARCALPPLDKCRLCWVAWLRLCKPVPLSLTANAPGARLYGAMSTCRIVNLEAIIRFRHGPGKGARQGGGEVTRHCRRARCEMQLLLQNLSTQEVQVQRAAMLFVTAECM